MTRLIIRPARPSDHGRVIGRLNAWWGGRNMAPMLPRLFFTHFEGTSFVVEGEDGDVAGFLVGFDSQTSPDEAYIHFIGIDPAWRGRGVVRALYERFFEAVRSHGRTAVRCVTSPVNTGSLAFHEAMGFVFEEVVEDYHGPGEARVLMVRRLD